MLLCLAAACSDEDEGAAPTPSATASAAPTATPPPATAIPSATPSPTPSASATASPSPTPTPTPEATDTPSAAPTATRTTVPTPTATATDAPLDCTTAGNICTVAGTGMSLFDGDGHPALETSFYFPIDLVFDAVGQPLIIDWNNLRVRRIDEDGSVRTIMGTGFEDFPGDGELAVNTPLHHASDIEFDGEGRLFVAGDHVPVVFRVDTDERVYTVAGGFDYGYSGDGGPALEAELSTPFGVMPDSAGGLFISDTDAQVVRYVDADGIIHTAAGNGTLGYSGDGGPATEAELAGPSRLRFGPDGALYFCETKNHVVRRLKTDGTIDTVAGNGERGYSGDGGAATAARFNGPYDLRFAPNGDLYIADTGNNVIRRVDTSGIVTTVVGNGEPEFSGDGGPASLAGLRRPSSVIFASDGSLWICDTSNHRVRRIAAFLSTQ